tara:strand:+ start:69 stop:665 length:597 start_codon:yes stop_codon:yes gene_type:complete
MPYYCGYCNVEDPGDYGLGLCKSCLFNLENIEDEMYQDKNDMLLKKYKCAECKDTGIYYRDYACNVCYIEPTEEEKEVSWLQQLHEKELLKQKQQHEKELLEQKNKSGIIYLIQPCELVETKRYKVGMSKNTSLDRVKNGYKKGSRYLCIMEVKNPVQVEKNIIKVFNETYKIIAGKEYYQIDVEEKEMIKLFINTIL